jgi:hypothetical protein
MNNGLIIIAFYSAVKYSIKIMTKIIADNHQYVPRWVKHINHKRHVLSTFVFDRYSREKSPFKHTYNHAISSAIQITAKNAEKPVFIGVFNDCF